MGAHPLRHSLMTSSDFQKLNKLYTRKGGKAAFGSVANLVSESGFSRKTVEDFLATKDAYTQYSQAKWKFNRLSATSRFINDIWCADVAFVDKLASFNKGYTCLLVCIDLFCRRLRVQPMKNKLSKSIKQAFLKMRTFPRKLWVDQGKKIEGE